VFLRHDLFWFPISIPLYFLNYLILATNPMKQQILDFLSGKEIVEKPAK
jgi:hypothetical protein